MFQNPTMILDLFMYAVKLSARVHFTDISYSNLNHDDTTKIGLCLLAKNFLDDLDYKWLSLMLSFYHCQES